MLVGQDLGALVDWAVGFVELFDERPEPRIGIHYGPTLYRDGDYFGREVNLASRVVARARGGEVLVTDFVVDQVDEQHRPPRLRGHRHREAQGLRRAAHPLPRRALARGLMERPLEAARASGPGGRGAARAGDALRRRRLGLPARRVPAAGRARSSALHVNYGLREGADADEAFCRELCERLGGAARRRGGRRCRRRATCRPPPARRATPPPSATPRATTPPATPPATRPRPCSTGWPPRPGGGRCWAWSRGAAGWCARCCEATREEVRDYLRGRGLEWREDPSNADRRFARSRARGELVPALRSLGPAAERNVAETALLLREEAEVLDAAAAEALAGLGGGPAVELARLRELEPALARLVLRRLAGDVAALASRRRRLLALGDARRHALPRPGRRPAGGERVRGASFHARARGRAAAGRRAGGAGHARASAAGRSRPRSRRPARCRCARPRRFTVRVLARRRPHAPGGPGRHQVAPGPVHRPQGAPGAAARRCRWCARGTRWCGWRGWRVDERWAGGPRACRPVRAASSVSRAWRPSERSWCRATSSPTASAARRADLRGLRGPRPAAGRRPEGRLLLPLRPDARRSTVPCEVDFMAVASYGDSTTPAAWSASSRTSTPPSRAARC